MRPIRCIHLDGLKYKYISVTQDERTMCVRVLYPMVSRDNRALGNSSDILTTDSLLWQILDLNGDLFQVVAEGFFSLDNPLHKQWFKSNANICFVANAAFPYGVISVVPQHLVANNTFEHTPDWAKREGVTVLAQLYVWSDTDTVKDCSKSFAVDNKGKLFTNFDLSNITHVSQDWMQREDRSAFLTLQHDLTCKANVENGCIDCTFTCFNLGNIVDVQGTYLVECSAGYIPLREVHVENGVGQFTWYPLYLPQNATVRFVVKDVQGYPCCERILRFNHA